MVTWSTGTLLALTASPAAGQSLEMALMPGSVIEGHAKLESDCKHCHVRFDRAAQRRLCLDCHKEVAGDVRSRSGHHGRLTATECRTCHTEHKGRDAKIVVLDEKTFDHSLTDFRLADRHAGVSCQSCHRPRTKHRAAPTECAGCHGKDDRHKGGLGARCESCHTAKTWADARFDHATTRFALLGRHAQTRCAGCHAGERWANTPRDCAACHRKDDVHKGHFGSRCEACHTAAEWKTSTFQHDRDTRFPLRDRHRGVKCASCHTTPLDRGKTPTGCVACHRKDDVHAGALGPRCEACHTERGWKATRFDHDRDSRFPLRDGHRTVKCESCHRGTGFRDRPPSACVGCHEKDDRERAHRGRYGDRCDVCHVARGWKALVFAHDRDTGFALRGRHREARCDACHRGALYRDRTDRRCLACHRAEDKHAGQLGPRCKSCHDERTWRGTGFDHTRSRFPLRGGHARVECGQCHLTLAFKDTRTECVACHAKADRHKERLGLRCEQCHEERSWRAWDFDHGWRTRFALDGAHARVACLACHTRPVTDRVELASDCFGCHRKDDAHLGSFGPGCDRCHVPATWRRIVKRDR